VQRVNRPSAAISTDFELAGDGVGSLQSQRGHGERAVATTTRHHRSAAWQKQVRMIVSPTIHIHNRGRCIRPHNRSAHDMVGIGEFGRNLCARRTQCVSNLPHQQDRKLRRASAYIFADIVLAARLVDPEPVFFVRQSETIIGIRKQFVFDGDFHCACR